VEERLLKLLEERPGKLEDVIAIGCVCSPI